VEMGDHILVSADDHRVPSAGRFYEPIQAKYAGWAPLWADA
jgi:hypothetical protein